MICDFQKDFIFSLGERQKFDISLLKSAIPNCVDVRKTDEKTDKTGVDYIAVLDGGAIINIDGKARRKGAIKDGCEPNLAIETWSVCPIGNKKGKPGWTFNRKTPVDMILYTFDPSEWNKFYLVPFHHLRMASQRNYYDWRNKYVPRRQNNGSYYSEAMFVPASVVITAISKEMYGIVKADLN